ncbi:unnamed protein product [Protopolystoma xenopodis]|uniref:Protein kinase domain-containing protein n=1 Tax=Protopolystoma xenopodis TaxID=117903 RepID=A0A448X9X5_9PLAT|nr:unnamed protein product [Protopolystoma xenopodis]
MLAYNPAHRATAWICLQHPWITGDHDPRLEVWDPNLVSLPLVCAPEGPINEDQQTIMQHMLNKRLPQSIPRHLAYPWPVSFIINLL